MRPVVILSNMKAELMLRQRLVLDETAFAETVIWRVSPPARGSAHRFKYRLALVVENVCVLRYDNEAGKGDHKHVGDAQVAYQFADIDTLQADFWADVEEWMGKP